MIFFCGGQKLLHTQLSNNKKIVYHGFSSVCNEHVSEPLAGCGDLEEPYFRSLICSTDIYQASPMSWSVREAEERKINGTVSAFRMLTIYQGTSQNVSADFQIVNLTPLVYRF